jgi:transcriptional regulator with XRE-family HTH domain
LDGFLEIGQRLRTQRLAAGMSAEQAARAIGVSRALLYRYESGQIVKLDTLERLARLYQSSPTALLGFGNEYLTNGLTFFERLQKYEAEADQMTIVFGPMAYVLTSEHYDAALAAALGGAADPADPAEALGAAECERLTGILKHRKSVFRARQPGLINIMPLGDLERYLANGLGGSPDLPYAARNARRREALREVERMAGLLAAPPMGVQIAITPRPLPTAGFQILRTGVRRMLVTSPFRVGEPLNLRYGVAMFTEDSEAVRIHENLAQRLWETALKGGKAVDALNKLLRLHRS